MKKKIIPLLFFLLASYIAHAASVDDGSVDDGAPAAVSKEEDFQDSYLQLVENYPSFLADCIRMDYLYNLDANRSPKFHSMKKMDWSNLLRANIAFLYAIRINQSRFALCLGAGFSSLCYSFAGQKRDADMTYPTLKRTSKFFTDCPDLDNDEARKYTYSGIRISFVDVLGRLRFNSVLDDPKAGFHIWLGGKLGFRRSASSIVNYKEFGDSGASYVEEGQFNLKGCVFAFQAGIGYARFGLTGSCHCTSLFEENKGPADTDSLRPFSFGIYVDLL